MKVYISGKITGEPRYKEMFAEAEGTLRAQGYDVVNPAGKDELEGEGHTWEEYMRHNIGLLVQCDGIYLLKNYCESQGALLESDIAESLGLWIKHSTSTQSLAV